MISIEQPSKRRKGKGRDDWSAASQCSRNSSSTQFDECEGYKEGSTWSNMSSLSTASEIEFDEAESASTSPSDNYLQASFATVPNSSQASDDTQSLTSVDTSTGQGQVVHRERSVNNLLGVAWASRAFLAVAVENKIQTIIDFIEDLSPTKLAEMLAQSAFRLLARAVPVVGEALILKDLYDLGDHAVATVDAALVAETDEERAPLAIGFAALIVELAVSQLIKMGQLKMRRRSNIQSFGDHHAKGTNVISIEKNLSPSEIAKRRGRLAGHPVLQSVNDVKALKASLRSTFKPIHKSNTRAFRKQVLGSIGERKHKFSTWLQKSSNWDAGRRSHLASGAPEMIGIELRSRNRRMGAKFERKGLGLVNKYKNVFGYPVEEHTAKHLLSRGILNAEDISEWNPVD